MSFQNLTEIAILPTSAPIAPQMKGEFEDFFNPRGIKLRYLLDPYQSYGSNEHLFSSQSSSDRLLALEAELSSAKPAVILASRGGVGAQEILPGFEGLPQAVASKVFCGFSDFTFLLGGLSKKGAIPVHGPSLLSFRKEVPIEVREANWNHLSGLLSGETELLAAVDCSHLSGGKTQVAGMLAGGNLSVLCSLMGTPDEVDLTGRILFLEEVGESPHRVYRNLLHLYNAGKLGAVSGVLVGEFLKCEHPQGLGPSIEDLLHHLFDNSSIPVYRTSLFGHGERLQSFPFGMTASLSSKGLALTKALSF